MLKGAPQARELLCGIPSPHRGHRPVERRPQGRSRRPRLVGGATGRQCDRGGAEVDADQPHGADLRLLTQQQTAAPGEQWPAAGRRPLSRGQRSHGVTPPQLCQVVPVISWTAFSPAMPARPGGLPRLIRRPAGWPRRCGSVPRAARCGGAVRCGGGRGRINRVLAVSPPVIGPAKLAYRPCTGLTPANRAAAMPSGTLPTAPGTPASRSRTRYRRCGATDRSHPQAACPADPDLDITTRPASRIAPSRKGHLPGSRLMLQHQQPSPP